MENLDQYLDGDLEKFKKSLLVVFNIDSIPVIITHAGLNAIKYYVVSFFSNNIEKEMEKAFNRIVKECNITEKDINEFVKGWKQ